MLTKADFYPSQHCDEHSAYRKGCDSCRLARNAYSKALYRAGKEGRSARLPVEGSRRRIQAMIRLGFGPKYIAHRLGTSRGSLQNLRYTQKYISQAKARAIAALYEELEAKPVNRKLTNRHQKGVRSKGARLGYAPPMAWNDIDRDEAPQGMEPERFQRVNEKLEEAAFLKSYGLTEETIAARLGVTVATLRSWSYPSQQARRVA